MNKVSIIICLLICGYALISQNGKLELVPDHFDFKTGTVEFLNYKGQKSMKLAANSGQVVVRNLNFKDGIVEFDVEPILPGFAQSVYFHRKDQKEQEIVYLRVTKIGDKLANEAIQYTPYFDGVNMWDMYPEYQAPAPIRQDDWNHMKLVICGKRMRVYLNENKEPVLDIPQLEGNLSEGSIAFEGASYIANISISANQVEGLHPEPAPDLTAHQSNYIRHWTMTDPLSLPSGQEVNREKIPGNQAFTKTINSERMGLINLTRVYGMSNDRRVVWLKAVIESAENQQNSLQLGFSDEVWVFLDNQLVAVDKNIFAQATRKYPKGRISIDNTRIPIFLHKGKNEICIAVANDFYGWGLIARLTSTDDLLSIEKYIPPIPIPIENIGQYLGKYTSDQAAMKITITNENGVLKAAADTQPAVEFTYKGNNVFELTSEKIEIEFRPSDKKLIFKQNGTALNFSMVK